MSDSPPPTRPVSPGDQSADGTRDIAICEDGSTSPGGATAGERYVIGDEIARGGMGAVYRAEDTVLGREVAVKVLLGTAGPSARTRFAEEARITARLQHPSVPPVHDLGTLPDGRPFLAMKLIRGHTLEKLLADRPDLPADRGRLLAVFGQIAQALGYAHAHGVIHRDLKPSNVMVGGFGETQVMDWGLAKDRNAPNRTPDATEARAGATAADPERTTDAGWAAPTDARTRVGQVMGTPAYMPPEQARGEVERVDARSDVFALGGILCRILTGRPPHTGGVGDVLRQAAEGVSGDTRARIDGCGADAELIALCHRCLAADPDERPADGGEVARLVAEHQAGVERRMRDAERERAEAAVRAGEWRKRRRVQWVAAGLTVALAAGIAGFVWWQGWQDVQTRLRDAHANAERTRLEGEKRLVEEREAATAREKRARNGDALAVHVGRCEAALAADDTDAAGEALAEIDRRWADGGGERLAGRVERCRADYRMLGVLDGLDNDRWGAGGGRRVPTGADIGRKLAEAFAGFGLVPGRTPAEQAVAALATTRIRDRLLSALDLWLVYDPTPAVRELLAQADPDEYRGQLREAITAKNGPLLHALVESPDLLAQPLRFAVSFGVLGPADRLRRQAMLEAGLRAHPDRFQAHMALAVSYQPGNPDTAAARRRCYTAAAALRPNHAVVFNNLGVALKDGGEFEAASAAYERSIRLDPTYPPPHSNLGAALAHRNRLDDALPHFKEAARLDPTNPMIHYNLAAALKLKGDADAALVSFRDAVAADPKFALGHTALGNAYAQKGEWAKAAESHRRTADLEPKNASARYHLATALVRLEDYAGGVEALEAAVKLDPDNPKFTEALAAAKKALADKGKK